jgi:hypothetical protein
MPTAISSSYNFPPVLVPTVAVEEKAAAKVPPPSPAKTVQQSPAKNAPAKAPSQNQEQKAVAVASVPGQPKKDSYPGNLRPDNPTANLNKPAAESPFRQSGTPRSNLLAQNLNVLFIGTNRQKLLTATIYSVNYRDRYQQAALVLPIGAFFPPEWAKPRMPLSQARPLANIYQQEGSSGLVRAVNESLGVEIDYFIRIDQRVLQKVADVINPIAVNDKRVEVENLFTMRATPADEQIMGALLAELTRPHVYFFHLPRIVLTSRGYLETDFAITPKNLRLHYKLIRRVDTRAVPKITIPTVPAPWLGETARVVPEDWMREVQNQISTAGLSQ